MTDKRPPKHPSIDAGRRRFLSTGLALGGVAAAATLGGPRRAVADDAAITDIQDWNRYLGDGVVARPYGQPSEFESHVVRRDVEWLTASRESSVSFTPLHELDGIITPNGLCFERHHAGIAHVIGLGIGDDEVEHRHGGLGAPRLDRDDHHRLAGPVARVDG